MKKLMFAAAAAFCGTVFGLESANVVGYGEADLNLDYTGVGPMFFSIGEDVVSVQNLKVKGLTEAQGTGYTIAPITSTGNIPVKYYYWCGLSEYGVKDGWYTTADGATIEAAAGEGKSDDYLVDYTFKPGEAAVTFMAVSGLGLKITSPIK